MSLLVDNCSYIDISTDLDLFLIPMRKHYKNLWYLELVSSFSTISLSSKTRIVAFSKSNICDLQIFLKFSSLNSVQSLFLQQINPKSSRYVFP